jgi:hypothetical protein
MKYSTQVEKQAAIDAQQVVVNAAVGQPAIDAENAKLSEVKAAKVVPVV